MTDKIRVGFDGNFEVKEVAVAAGDPAPWDPSQKFSIVGTRVPRLDGKAKTTGAARYSIDVRLPGMLYARILRCPLAAATVTSVDVAEAKKMPGVRAVLVIAEKGERIRFAGQEIAAVAAETPEQASDALGAVQVAYTPRAFVVGIEAARKDGAPLVFDGHVETKTSGGDVESKAKGLARKGNVLGPRATNKGNVEEGFRKADQVVEATYVTQVQTHSALETHGLVAKWDGDDLTVWGSTQAVFDMRDELAKSLNVPVSKVRVITEYMGGGFGAKFGPRVEGVTAARLAKAAGAPVKLFLDRKEEQLASGNRPSAVQTVKAGATKDGKLTALQLTVYGNGGTNGGTGTSGPIKNVYACDNLKVDEYDVFTNAGPSTAMRAPGHPQGAFALEATMDELAKAIGMDPLEFRMKNDPSAVRREEFRIGAEKIGWKGRDERRQTSDPSIRRGVGVGAAVWYNTGGTGPRATVKIHRDGSAEIEHGLQDLGTGSRTMVAIVGAEELGLPLDKVSVAVGDTKLPYGPGSGGSTTTPSSAPAIRRAAWQAKRELAKAIARTWNVSADSVTVAGGFVSAPGNPAHKISFAEACAKLPGRGRLRHGRPRREPRRRLEALHDGRPVRRGRGGHRDRQGPGRARRRRPRLRRARQPAGRREPDPGRRHPGHVVCPLRGPRPRPKDGPHGQPERRELQDRRRARRARHRRHARLRLGWSQQHELGRHRRAVDRGDGGGHRQRRLARDRGADQTDPDHARGRARGAAGVRDEAPTREAVA